jgi:IclR family acetate operon transcriptional repressor
VGRALTLLEAVVAGGETGLTQLAEVVELSPSTTHRLLATLVASGYVAQGEENGLYGVGPKLRVVADRALAVSPGLLHTAQGEMLAVRDRYDETVNLVELQGWKALYVDQVESSRPVRMFNQVGNLVDLHASAAGKAMLAHQMPEMIEAFLASAPFKRMTERTISQASGLRVELERIRESGYSLDNQERDDGVVCVAAPVLISGTVSRAAVSMSGPVDRMERLDLDRVGSSLAKAALAIAEKLAA